MEMKTMMRVYAYGLCLSLLSSCVGSVTDTDTLSSSTVQQEASSPAKPQVETQALDLSPFGDMTSIQVPVRGRTGVDASVEHDETSGYIHVRAGKGFHLVIREEPVSLEDIQAELSRELMWKNEIQHQGQNSIIIQRSLPDGSASQFHFATVLAGHGTNIVIKSDPMGEFDQKDVLRMIESAETISIDQGLVASKNHTL